MKEPPKAIDKATVELTEARDLFVEAVCDFIRAYGVKLTTTPPALVEKAMHFGARCIDIGKQYAHDKDTMPSSASLELAKSSSKSQVHPAIAPLQPGPWDVDARTPVQIGRKKSSRPPEPKPKPDRKPDASRRPRRASGRAPSTAARR